VLLGECKSATVTVAAFPCVFKPFHRKERVLVRVGIALVVKVVAVATAASAMTERSLAI
jgi:hypothetical protein